MSEESFIKLMQTIEKKRTFFYLKSLSSKNRFLREKNVSNMKLCDSFIEELKRSEKR